MTRPVDWVVFDLGETLVDETANWARWAAHFGVPALTFFGVLGGMVVQGRPHTDVFTHFRPGFRFEEDRRAVPWELTAADLYPDALPALAELRTAGYRLAVMANQPLSAAAFLATLPVELTATSEGWGVHKPDPAFFARVADTVGARAERIAYVGDRVDNDVLPAKAAGMLAVHLRRGPWGHLQAGQAAAADLRLDRLDGADGLAAALGAGR